MSISRALADGLAVKGANIIISDRDKSKQQTYKLYTDERVDL